MKNRRKVCVVVTARPSYSRIKTVLQAIRAHPLLNLQLVIGASALLRKFGQVVDVIKKDGFEPDAVVYMVIEGENLVTTAKSTGLGVVELATIFDSLKPDIVITVADRYETIATAIAASYLNIPLGHVQGGEVSGSIDEKVRHAVTKLSDLHFVATEKASERVIRMGEDPDKVFVTGCPSIDLAAEVLESPDLGFNPFEKYTGVGPTFDFSEAGYLVVLQHPVTTECGSAREQIDATLHAVCEAGLPAFIFWPNVDAGSEGIAKGIRVFRESHEDKNIHFFISMEPEDFLRLLYNCKCLIGNSSVGIRESVFLGVPVVNVGSRQAGRERGENVIDVEYDRSAILEALQQQVDHGPYPSSTLYGDSKAGVRIAELLAECKLGIEKKLTY